MSLFEDELKKYAPGMPKKSMQVLEAEYGNCAGFCTGLDVFARVLLSDQLPKQTPAFGEPWKSIYSDTVRIFQQGGGTLTLSDAQYDAIDLNGRPNTALNDAITKRQTAIAQSMALKGNKKTSDDYKTQLSILGYDIRLNLAGNKIEVNGDSLTDFTSANIRNDMKDTGFNKSEIIEDCIMSTAKENEYHPVYEYLESLKWDGKPHIQKLAKYIQAVNIQIWPVLLRKWLIGSIMRALDGSQNPMIVLDGPQGCGKSLFSKWLCPDKKLFREGPIDPDNRDDKIAAAEVWIWEVAELGSTTRRSDVDALKNFLTTENFTARAPYGRSNLQYKAMASYIGTINDVAGFLNDSTGARRYWVVEIDGINWKYTEEIDRDQVWAEAYAAYKAGETNALTDDEQKTIEDIDNEYRVINSVEEIIKDCFFLDPDGVNAGTFTSFKDIRGVLRDPTRGNLSAVEASDRKISEALKVLGLRKTDKRLPSTGLGVNQVVHVKGYLGIWPK